MNLNEAIEEMKKGNKMRCEHWRKGWFILETNEHKTIMLQHQNKPSEKWEIALEDIGATNWVIFGNKKQKTIRVEVEEDDELMDYLDTIGYHWDIEKPCLDKQRVKDALSTMKWIYLKLN